MNECPRKAIGRQLTEAINLAAYAKDIWPVRGGLLDQSSWFVNVKMQLDADEAALAAEK